MDIESLKAFIAVSQHRSFSVAAEHLYLTQPAVSKRINSLEQHLQHTLFNRHNREITLTEAGENLLPKALNVLRSLDEAQNAMNDLSGDVAGTLRLATSHHIGLHHLPPILRKFSSVYPKVNMHIEFLDSEVAHNKILKGECDVAVVTLEPFTKNATINATLLWRDPLCFVAAHNHPLFTRPVTLQTLSQTPAILPDLNTYTGRIAKAFFDQEQQSINVSMTTNYLETIKMMVSVGLGWSLLPQTLVDDNLRTIDIEHSHLSRDLGVITHAKRDLNRAARSFLAIINANQSAF